MAANTKLAADLSALLGAEKVLTSEEALIGSMHNELLYERAHGYSFPHLPQCVVKPANTEDVSKLLKFCNDNGVNVIPLSAGSRSGSLGFVPVNDNTVVLDCAALNTYEIDEYNMTATVGAGMPGARLEEIIRPMGMTCGHFPQSFPLAQYGGLVSTRSMGQFSTYFGAIEDMLVGLEVVLADGTVCEIRPVPRRATGPDLKHIFMGAEGTMGVITQVTIKLFKYHPHMDLWMGGWIMPDYEKGLKCVREILTQGYKPAVARLYDKPDYDRNYGTLELADGEAYMFFVADGPEKIQEVTGAAITKIAGEFGGRPVDNKVIEHWLIHVDDMCDTAGSADKGLEQALKSDIRYSTITIAANWSELLAIYNDVMAEIPGMMGEQLLLLGGHISHCYHNGANIYFVYEWKINDASNAINEMMKLQIAVGEIAVRYKSGTVEHHHGVGRARAHLMPLEHGTSYEVLRRMKNVLDPKNTLNPGVLLPVDTL